MENIFTQIAVGFSPAALLFILLSVFAKKNRIRNICIAAISVCAAGGCFIGGLLQSSGSSVDLQSKADDLLFAYELLDEDEAALASDVIKASREDSAYTKDDTLVLARAALLDNRIQAAKSLYRKLEASDEQTAVLAIPSGYSSDKTLLNDAKKMIKSNINDYLDQSESDSYNTAAKVAAFAEKAYSDFLNGNDKDENVSKQLKKLLAACEETPELMAITPLRVSRLKLQLLDEDFKGIASSVDEYADHNELLIASELYMNGYIKVKDFSDSYKGDSLENYTAVIDAMQNVYSNYYADKSRDERNAAKAQLQSMKAFLKNPPLIKMKESLSEYAESSFAYDRSKVYLQLAKTENYMGNSAGANEYLDKSLNTVGDCDDAGYTAPMYEIIGIIADKDDPERLKDVAAYTDKILTNTMTVRMSEKLLEPAKTEDDKDNNNGGVNGEEINTSFSDSFNTYVSQKRMAINIAGVDTSEFETVKVNLNISGSLTYSIEELKQLLKVSDCEIDINDFTLEKVTYTGANILICADVSGSMIGQPIEDLRNAVRMFVESSDEIESVALVTFNDSISGVWNFGTPNEELIAAAQSLRAYGGTNMYEAVQNALSYFSPNPDEISCVILISDGEDNYPAGIDDIYKNVGDPYKQKGVTLYSLGLGSGAAGNYLNSLAASTGGSYYYAAGSAQINSFFDGIRAQILNSYRLTFKAEDTIQNARNLRVALDGESYTYDERLYSLDGSSQDGSTDTDNVIYLEGKSLNGFEEKLVFKSDRSRKLNFKGEGFESTDKFTLSLEGNINYDSLAYEYVDKNTLSVTIPAGIACDTYDVRVSVNGKKTVLTSGLTVAVQGGEKQTVFGDYVFTSYFKMTENGQTRLSEYVQLNGWLNFRGDVILTGDLDGQSITMQTDKQEYVHYYADTAEGLATIFIDKDVPVPALGTLTLYNQTLFADPSGEGNDNEIRVDSVPLPSVALTGFMRLSKPGAGLYPDRIAVESNSFSTDLPFQQELLNGLGLFTFETNIGGSIGAKSIDLKIELGASSGEGEGKFANSPANLGNIPILMNTDEFELRLDTYENEFYVKYVAALPFLTDEPSFGASVQWKWGDKSDPGIKFDELMFYADFDVPMKGSPVDLTFSGFRAGIKGMTEDNPLFVGGCDISAYKLKSLMPGIEKWLGDIAEVSVVSADDTEISFGLKDFYIKAETTIHCLKYIELGGVSVELGKFPYANKLLGMEDETVNGLSAKVKAGPAIHVANCDISMQGEVEVTGTDKAIVLPGVEGNIDFAVSWWVFTKEFHKQGKALLGVQFTHDGDTVFMAKASDGKDVFYIAYSMRRGADYGKESL